MGGVSVDSGGKGGRRQLNSEINLIPMIDLLIVSISFLLITAVWTQLSRLDVQQSMPGGQSSEEQQQRVRLSLKIKPEGFEVVSTEVTKIAKKGEEYDFVKLTAELDKLRTTFADRHDFIVAPEDGVKYDDIVRSMDLAIQKDFTMLTMADGSSL